MYRAWRTCYIFAISQQLPAASSYIDSSRTCSTRTIHSSVAVRNVTAELLVGPVVVPTLFVERSKISRPSRV